MPPFALAFICLANKSMRVHVHVDFWGMARVDGEDGRESDGMLARFT